MHIDVKLLNCFVTLAERLNFGITASELNMTQPTLSARIKRLEEDLGIDLFVRTTRKVELTRFGAELLPSATELVRMHNDFEHRITDLARVHKGRVRLGMPFYNSSLSERETLFRDFELECSDVQVSVSYGFKQQLIANLEAGHIDLALLIAYPVTRPQFCAEQAEVDTCELIIPNDLPHVTLGTRDVMLALPSAHPLARFEVIPRSALDGERIACFDPKHGSSFTKPVLEVLKQSGAIVEIPLEAHDIALESHVRRRGTPSLTVGWFRPSRAQDDICYRRVEGIDMTTSLQLVRSNDYPSPAMIRLWRAAERFAARGLAPLPRETPTMAALAG